jgi:hypothetical protein
MKPSRLSLRLALFCMMFLSIACTSTKFSTVWKDETYQGHPEKIMVINSFPNPAARRIFEEEFVEALKERGIDAVMSYPTMPDAVVPDKDTVTAHAKEVGADAVLITSSIGPKMAATGDRYMNTQTEVYDTKSNRLFFSASAKTRIRPAAPYPNQIQSLVKDLVNQLSRQGLF